jgi:hypothetical protein
MFFWVVPESDNEAIFYDDRLRSWMELCILISGSSSKHHHSDDGVSIPSSIAKLTHGFVFSVTKYYLLLPSVLLCLLS